LSCSDDSDLGHCNLSLSVLDLTRNEIKELPDKLGLNFPNLQELYLSQYV